MVHDPNNKSGEAETGPDTESGLTGHYRLIAEDSSNTGNYRNLLRAADRIPHRVSNQNFRDVTAFNRKQINELADEMINSPNTREMVLNMLFALRASQREVVLSKSRLHDATHTISEFKKLAYQWQEIATKDQLTGAPNRYAFLMALEEVVSRYRELKQTDDEKLPDYAVAFIDIDKFKAINDTYGHDVGDLALKALAIRLEKVTRSNESFGRLSGDEFALLLMGDLEEASDFAEKAKTRLQTQMADLSIDLEGEIIPVNCSIGVHHVVDHHLEPTALLKQADSDMYVEKKGKGVARAIEMLPPAPEDPSQN